MRSMTRRRFSLLLPGLLLPFLPTLAHGKRGLTVKLEGLDPRFVAQLEVAAKSRQLTLEQYIVFAAVMQSGYHENDGFAER